MNVSFTVSREKERAYMKTFTIDNDNNITAFPTPDHAEAAVGMAISSRARRFASIRTWE